MPTQNNRPLGKGLSALINTGMISNSSTAYDENFDIKFISPNPYQPRMKINPEDLIELADSIREHGIIQPLIITKDEKNGNYFLIAGERRFKAAQLAGLKRVPVVIKDSSPQEMLELALIENIQRQDLNPLEEALAFKQLQDEFGLKQNDIAKKVGLSRVAVTNKIRLLGLPEQVKEAVLNLLISEGHARALLGLRDPQSIMAATNIVIKRSLSVRETEQLIRRINYAKEDMPKKPSELEKEIKDWESRIAKRLGFTSRIKNLASGGKIIIRYTDENELRELVSRLTR